MTAPSSGGSTPDSDAQRRELNLSIAEEVRSQHKRWAIGLSPILIVLGAATLTTFRPSWWPWVWDLKTVAATTGILAGLSTLAVAFFAAVQLWQARRARLAREKGAYRTLLFEQFRIWRVCVMLESEDLVALASHDLLPMEDLGPGDAASIYTALAQTNAGTTALAALAYQFLAEVKQQARGLRASVQAGTSAEADRRKAEAAIKSGLKEAEEILEDALAAAPLHVLTHQFTVRSPRSTMGKRVADHVRELNAASLARLPWWRRAWHRLTGL